MVIAGTDIRLLEIGREYIRQKRAKEKMQDLESHLGGVDL